MNKVKGTVCLYIPLLAKHNTNNAVRTGSIVAATITQSHSVRIIAAQNSETLPNW